MQVPRIATRLTSHYETLSLSLSHTHTHTHTNYHKDAQIVHLPVFVKQVESGRRYPVLSGEYLLQTPHSFLPRNAHFKVSACRGTDKNFHPSNFATVRSASSGPATSVRIWRHPLSPAVSAHQSVVVVRTLFLHATTEQRTRSFPDKGRRCWVTE